MNYVCLSNIAVEVCSGAAAGNVESEKSRKPLILAFEKVLPSKGETQQLAYRKSSITFKRKEMEENLQRTIFMNLRSGNQMVV
jgi:hypothetical protein